MVSVLAALIVTLNKLAVPESVLVPLKVAVPLLAVNDAETATEKFCSSVKLIEVDIVPKTLSE